MAAASYTTDLIDWIADNDKTAWTELTNATSGGAPDEVDTESALQDTTIPVDAKKMNGADIVGDGSEADPWRGVGVSP